MSFVHAGKHTCRPASRLFGRALLVVAMLCCTAARAAGPQMPPELVNPGFDLQGASGVPAGWSLDQGVKGKGTLALVDGYRGATGRVLQLQPNQRNTGDKLLGVGQLLDAAPWRGQSVEVQARLGASAGGRAVVGVHALGKSGDLGFVQLGQDDSAGDLKAQNRSLAVPAAAQFLVVYAIAAGTTGTALFDSVQLATAASVGAAPAAGAASSSAPADISIDVRRTVRQIPPGVYGTNAEWIFNGQGLWSDSERALDAGALQMGRELAPTVIRFPGGVFSDYYHWRDGIGAQDQRPTTLNHPGGPKSRHAVGSQEIAAVARHTGSQLMLTVNAGSGTPEEAAGWVRYARQEMQPRVRLWEVGNELYMKGDLSGGAMSAEQYSSKFLAFASAMRAADPDIRVGAIGGLNYGSYRFISDDRWTEKLLKQAAPQMDFLAVHNAYAPVVMGVKDDADPRAVYRAMLAAPRQIEANLRDVSALLAKYESKSRPISIAVTEWGPFFHVLPTSPWVDHAKTMGSALFVASTLNVFLRSPRVDLANFFKLTDHGFLGWIGRRDGKWVHTAPGMAFMLYRQALGTTLVETQVVSPSFATNGIGVVNAIADIPWLDAVATFDQGTLVVMLVNRSDSLTLNGRIALKGVHSYAKAGAKTLSANSFDAHTGTQLPQIAGLKWARQIDMGRFGRGAPEEVRMHQESLPAPASKNPVEASLNYSLRPLSITALRFDQVRLAK